SDYFQFDGEKLRDEVRAWLLKQGPGRVGTGDDNYDGTLMNLIGITYAYYYELGDAHVQNKLINELFSVHGPFDDHDLQEPEQKALGLKLDITETENHVLRIEVARYLTNQLRFRRERHPDFDNERNGMDEWMLKYLREFLVRDFIEYNARP